MMMTKDCTMLIATSFMRYRPFISVAWYTAANSP